MGTLISVGWMWVDNRQDQDLREKVLAGAQRYRSKFGRSPNICYVNASLLNQPEVECQGVRIIGASNIPRHHFWMGVVEEESVAH